MRSENNNGAKRPHTLESLEMILEGGGIDPQVWNKMGAIKDSKRLLREICNNELILQVSIGKDGNDIVCLKWVVNALVYHKRHSTLFVLREDRQVFKKNGKERVRKKKHSLGEKLFIQPREHHGMGLRRALMEELDFYRNAIVSFQGKKEKARKISKSYPGLPTQSTAYVYDVIIPEKEYKRRGYKENQSDKTTYFSWKKAPFSFKSLSVHKKVRALSKKRRKSIRKRVAIERICLKKAYILK